MTATQLRRYFPSLVDAALWAAVLSEAMTRYGITTPARGSAFLAQVGHECGIRRVTAHVRLVENLNYSAAGLRATWPTRFRDDAFAGLYARQPERIANYVYGGRMGNGDVSSGDGWGFRGRGLLMITGRGTYRSTGLALGLDLETHPALLEQPRAAALAAAHFWAARGLNKIADAGDEAAFGRITRAINGGTHGLASRRQYWTRAQELFV